MQKEMQIEIITVNTEFGTIDVEFEVLKEYPNEMKLLFSQDRLVIGQKMVNGKWKIGDSLDVFTLIHKFKLQ